mmetsp:Transcript_32735/g.70758  ORF Transcript_32735/g.70758 Transcript_32735/m.70758 type:complete len:198 (+) Transcript_32735:909-1502(+)
MLPAFCCLRFRERSPPPRRRERRWNPQQRSRSSPRCKPPPKRARASIPQPSPNLYWRPSRFCFPRALKWKIAKYRRTFRLLLLTGALLQISIFNWLSLITGEWRRGQASRHLDLRHLYRMFDANGDNVLDLREFTDMTRFVVPKLSDRVIMQLFNEAHAEEGEDTDVMDLERFCSVMIQNRFCPPFIDFSKVQGVTK